MRQTDNPDPRPPSAPSVTGFRTALRWSHPLWWLLGILGALAMVGTLDALGLVPAGWMQVVDSLGGRWMDGMAALSAWLDGRLPYGMMLGAREAAFALVVLVTILPVTIARAVVSDRPVERVDRVLRYAGLVFVVYGMAIVLAPGRMADTPDIFASAVVATCVGFILSISATGIHDADSDANRRMLIGVAPLILLFLGEPLGWTVSDVFYSAAMVVAGLAAFISVSLILFRVARPYVTAFAVTLGVITAIQLLSIVPAVAQQIAPFF
jgi:hypothetical protein